VIADLESDTYLGAIVLLCDRPHGIVELGYTVHPSARGRGIGTRGVRLAAGWAFAALDAKRLEARTDPANVPSRRLLASAGFTRERLERKSREINGVRCDVICWSMLPTDVTGTTASG
jgi:RimJ/RimL family protein N-acetyltransferase